MVKQAVSIPVFGNGDVFDAQDCLRMLQTTGCDGVALGRMAIAKPWLFAQWTQDLQPSGDVCKLVALRLCRLLPQYFEPKGALLRNAEDFETIEGLLLAFFNNAPKELKRPNMNFLH